MEKLKKAQHARVLATLVVVGVPSTCQESHLAGKRGASQGSHWVWEGTPSPVQGDATNVITSLEDRYVSNAVQ